MDDAVILVREHCNRLRGRLFQLVEAVGLPGQQEQAFKGLIRQLSYDAQRDLERTVRGVSDAWHSSD